MMMGFGLLAMLLFGGVVLALLVGGGVLLFRSAGSSSLFHAGSEPTARRILDERLSRGEISREEYDEIRAEISKQ